jgi:hypothetical protein
MPRWLTTVLARIRKLAAEEKVRVTLKAMRELAALGLDVDDAVEIIAGLRDTDSAGRKVSEGTGEWLYVFKPNVGGMTAYLKLVLRTDCIVISLHDDQEDDHDEQESQQDQNKR